MTLVPTPIRETGFSFVRISPDVKLSTKPATLTPPTDANHVVLICENRRLVENGLLGSLDTNPWALRHRMGHLGFVPFDAKAEFPGSDVRVITEVGDKFDFDAWVRTQLEVPAELDVVFERERFGSRPPAVVARTIKKGKLANVRVPIQPGTPFIENVTAILEKLRRTARAPAVDMFAAPMPDYTCGAHVAELVRTLDSIGVDMVKRWLQRDLELRGNTKSGHRYDGSQITIPGAFLIGAKVMKVVLTTTRKSNAVHATVTMRGQHTLEDDETGSTVKLRAQLPDAIVAAMRKRSVGDVIDADWARPLTIRTMPTNENGEIAFRAFSDNVPFALGEPVPVSDDEIETRLRRAFVDGRPGPDDTRFPLWDEVDTALVPVLQGLDRHDLSVVVAKLELYNQITLDEYGLEGWTIRSQGPRIATEKQPPVPVGELGVLRVEEGRKAA